MFRFNRSLLTLCVLFGTLSLCLAQGYTNFEDDMDDYDEAHSNMSAEKVAENSPVYQPTPARPPPPPQDPNVIMVPRMGLVRGQIGYKTIKNRAINSFQGLKYGVVGTGLSRFQKASVPQYNSNAPIDATREPANCPQFPDLKKITEAEARGENVDDCLTLNIHAPNKPGLHPVMVFIHGEMLFDGSAEEGQPDYFMEHDVVLVSVNYRLAPFGFLTTLSEEMPGNVALADIQMALEWVQHYVRFFGGNPEQVTLFGQAGGATLVHALSLSGKAQGLFHNLILQSGTALNPYFIDEDPITTTRSFARLARCPPTSRGVLSLISCFERLSTTELLTVFQKHWEDNEPRGLRFAGGFKLIVGDKLGYLTQHPAALVRENTYPTIAGVTKDAGVFILSRFYQELTQMRSRNISDYINVVLKHTTQPRHYQVWKNWALQYIFTEDDVRNPSLANLVQGLLELTNLILYRGPIIDSLRYTSRSYPTFFYSFDYRGQFQRFGHLNNPLPFAVDASLSDDNIYLFPYPEDVSQLNGEDKTMARTITRMWVNFAMYSQPNFNTEVWPNVTTEFGPFVRFSNSKERTLELDHNLCEGIPVPNLYPEYSATTTTTTTTQRPYSNYPNYPNYPNYHEQQQQRPAYRPPHETVLDNGHSQQQQQQQQQQHHQYPHQQSYTNARYSNQQGVH